jgi:hypothetical protein
MDCPPFLSAARGPTANIPCYCRSYIGATDYEGLSEFEKSSDKPNWKDLVGWVVRSAATHHERVPKPMGNCFAINPSYA